MNDYKNETPEQKARACTEVIAEICGLSPRDCERVEQHLVSEFGITMRHVAEAEKELGEWKSGFISFRKAYEKIIGAWPGGFPTAERELQLAFDKYVNAEKRANYLQRELNKSREELATALETLKRLSS